MVVPHVSSNVPICVTPLVFLWSSKFTVSFLNQTTARFCAAQYKLKPIIEVGKAVGFLPGESTRKVALPYIVCSKSVIKQLSFDLPYTILICKKDFSHLSILLAKLELHLHTDTKLRLTYMPYLFKSYLLTKHMVYSYRLVRLICRSLSI